LLDQDFHHYTGLFTFGEGKSNNISYTVALSRNNTYTNPIFPLGGSEFMLSARFSLPYSLWNGIDYATVYEILLDLPSPKVNSPV
jgi:outer membrane protein insertion porin family